MDENDENFVTSYSAAEMEIGLFIYFGSNERGDFKYWVNLSGASERPPFEHGIPFRPEFETHKEAAAFREKIAEWLGLVETPEQQELWNIG